MLRIETYDNDGNVTDVAERELTPKEELQKVMYARKSRYEAEGWKEPWDLLDDIMAQLEVHGIVLDAHTIRKAIKLAKPKQQG